MKEINFRNKKYELKTSYLEMTEKEFLKICFVRSKFLESIPVSMYHSLRIQAFYILSKIPFRHLLKLDNDQLADILPHIDFVFQDEAVFERNLMPSFKLGIFGKRFYAPAGMFDKCVMEEIAEADTAFIDAHGLKNIDKLYLLVAILYRPLRKDLKEFKASENYNGDDRELYNSQHVRDRIPMLKKKLPFYKAIAIFLFYAHFRNVEMLQSPVLKEIFNSETKSKGLNLGWLQTMLEVSNTKFGTFDQTIKQNWLVIMYDIALKMDKAQQKIAKQEEEEIRKTFKK